MLQMAGPIMDQLDERSRSAMEGQVGFFDEAEASGETPLTVPELPELPYNELLKMEKEVTGMYLTGHPLTPYQGHYKPLRADRLDRILTALEEGSGPYADGTSVRLLCLVGAVRLQTTKSNARMAYLQLEDLYGAIEGVAFPQVFTRQESLLQTGQVLLLQGRLDVQEDKEPKLLIERAEPVPETPPAAPAGDPRTAAAAKPAGTPASAAPSAHAGLYLRLPSDSGEVYRHTKRLVQVFEGPLPVVIRFADSGKLMRAPRDWWVDPQPVLLSELRRLLGDEHVVLRR